MCRQTEEMIFCIDDFKMILGKSTLNQISKNLHIVYDTENNDDSLELLGIKSYYNLDSDNINENNTVGMFMSTTFNKDTLKYISILFYSDNSMSKTMMMDYVKQKISCTIIEELLKLGIRKHGNVTESAKFKNVENSIHLEYNLSVD